ncbi:MAG: hypothetical protein KDC98_05210, partial [Planctomycetes bacterium]|nr:hypothetical protein [Planctomycetota bacterium]
MRFACLALLFVGTLLAQERTLVLQNVTPFARREVVATAVPFAEGEVEGLPDLHVRERPTV